MPTNGQYLTTISSCCDIVNFSWVTSKIRGGFVSELLRASWHSAPRPKTNFKYESDKLVLDNRLFTW